MGRERGDGAQQELVKMERRGRCQREERWRIIRTGKGAGKGKTRSGGEEKGR